MCFRRLADGYGGAHLCSSSACTLSASAVNFLSPSETASGILCLGVSATAAQEWNARVRAMVLQCINGYHQLATECPQCHRMASGQVYHVMMLQELVVGMRVKK